MTVHNKICGTAETPREKIMEAAMARFSYYGFGKTTMAEIAKDCGMSAANIYRFFENKRMSPPRSPRDSFRPRRNGWER